MKKLFTLLTLFMTIVSVSQAQTVDYVRDNSYGNRGMVYLPTLPASYRNGTATTCKINNDGTIYNALSQITDGSPYGIIALEKRKLNGTRDSSFATAGVASDYYYTDADIRTIESLTGNRLYCTSAGGGGYVNGPGITWSTQVYNGYVVAPNKTVVDACKYYDSTIISITAGYIETYKVNSGTGLTVYATLTSYPVNFDVNNDGTGNDPVLMQTIASTPGSHYYIAGRAFDSVLFIGKFTVGTDMPDPTFGNNGYVNIPFTYNRSGISIFNDIFVQNDGKILTSLEIQKPGSSSTSYELRRYNTNGSLDTVFGTGGSIDVGYNKAWKVKQMNGDKIAVLFTPDYSLYQSVAIFQYTQNGDFIRKNVFYEQKYPGADYLIVPSDFSYNTNEDIAICGYLIGDSTGYNKAFSMKLKKRTCNISLSNTGVTSSSVNVTASGSMIYPIYFYLYDGTVEDGSPIDSIVLNSGTATSFSGLNPNYPYYVVVIDANGCASDISTTTLSVGINNIESSNNITLYPNPTSSVLNFETTYDIKKIQIINMMGAVLKDEEINSKSVNVADLVAGNYVIKMTDDKNNLIIKRFIKE